MALHNVFYGLIDLWNECNEQQRCYLSPLCIPVGVLVLQSTIFSSHSRALKAFVLPLHTHQSQSFCDPGPVRPVFITKQLLQAHQAHTTHSTHPATAWCE